MFWFWIAFIAAAILVLALGEPTLRVLVTVKAGQTIREEAPERHRSKQGTPTMGGVLIITGLVGAVLFTLALWGTVGDGDLPQVWEPAVFCTTAIGFAGIGLLDDYLIIRRGKNLGLKARQKLLMQVGVGLAFVVYLYANAEVGITTVLRVGEWRWDVGLWYYPVALLFIVALSNAVNLSDGLDGLASGLTLIAASALGSIAGLLGGSWELQAAGALAGACAGFLYYNRYPARVFMGDTGSLALGGALAALVLLTKQEVLGMVVLLVFWVEMLSVVMQVIAFQTTGKRIFRMSPLHHHFELTGMHETRVVMLFWAMGLLCGAVGYLLAWVVR